MNWLNSTTNCILVLLLLSACDAPVQEKPAAGSNEFEQPLLDMNKYMLERHRDRIIAFIERTGWEMKETSSGLWYMILEEGNGRRTRQDMLVSYAYTTRLLDGTFCYEADTTSPKKIVLGKGGIETGLEEGLKLLKEGDRARLIIPPYLAHGNFGDGNKIPGSAILLVDLQVLEVKR